MTSVFRTSTFVAALGILAVGTLSGCSGVRKALGQVETAAAKNERGQLITPSVSTSEAAPTEASPATTETASMQSKSVPDIKRANLPSGLAGDTANQIYIGDAVVPK
jgi:hypothetical protein